MKIKQTLSHAMCFLSISFALSACGAQRDGSGLADTDEAEGSGQDPQVEPASSALSASACGTGYKLVGVIPFVKNTVAPFTVPNPPRGELEVFYNAANGKNCLVTQALGPLYGVPKHMFVRACLYPFTDSRCGLDAYDSGTFKYYAGPVFITAPHRCIYYSGAVYEPTGVVNYVPATDHGFCG